MPDQNPDAANAEEAASIASFEENELATMGSGEEEKEVAE